MPTRREILALLAAPAFAAEASPYLTPHKYGRLVLQASAEPGAFDSRTVDCPFVFHHGGRFYMTYVGWDGTGYQTGLASSANLVEWRKEGCILKRDPASPITRHNIAMNWIVRQNQLHSVGELRKVRGRFLGAFHAYPNAGLEEGPAVIGLCWSDNLLHWDIGDICLKPEDGTSWEEGGLYKPCLLEHEGTYYLFYNAKTAGRSWREQTGVATSKDLKTWTRYSGNPILPVGRPDSWDERFASDPCVLLNGKEWAMYYYGFDRTGKARDLLAVGLDPFHLTKVNAILVDVGLPGAVDSTFAHKPSVVYHQGALYHFYTAVSGKYPAEIRGIAVARSRPW